MPELPEVETVRRGLEKKLKNFIIEDIKILRSSTIAFPKDKEEFIRGVSNSKVGKWQRRGKYLIANLKKYSKSPKKNINNSYEDNGYLIIHLRMTGYFNWITTKTPPCKHTRVRFFLRDFEYFFKLAIKYFPLLCHLPNFELFTPLINSN